MARRKTKKAKGVRVDLSNVSKAFEPGEEYAVKVVECTLEEGQKAPYFNLKLAGVSEDYENSFMYHRASTSEASLWRLRPLLEALGIDIPDGPMDISPDDFVGRQAMCSTFLDRYEGGSSVKPEEFWPLEDGDEDEDEDEDEKEDEDEDEDEKGSEFDLDDLDDDDIKALAEALKIKGKKVSTLKKKLEEMDEDAVALAYKKLESGDDGDGDGGDSVSEDAVKEMNQDELEALVDEHDLEIDLSKHKTLRKKRNAVIDALEEADLLDD